MEDGVAIAERDWLICGLLWIIFGSVAVSPLGIASRIGRVLFALMLVVHTAEAVYVGIRARIAGLDAQRWFLRTMVVGALGMMKLEAYLRNVPGRGMAG